MLKYIGIILVSGAISLYGAHRSFLLKAWRSEREALYELLVYIKNGIDNGALALGTIYGGFENALLEKKGFTSLLKSGAPDAFSRALEQSELRLCGETRRLYETLAANLGKSGFHAAESEQLTRYMNLIREENRKLDESEEIRQVLYRKLGILCGLLAALLLL